MVKLELTTGTDVCFNLKSFDREKSLYNAWYSMSDMPKYQYKKFEITTDTDVHFLYAIRDIKNCTVTESVYIPPPPQPQSPPQQDGEEGLLQSALKMLMGRILTRYSSEQKERLSLFYIKLCRRNIKELLPDYETAQLIKGLLSDTKDNIDEYVERYIEYYNQKVKG